MNRLLVGLAVSTLTALIAPATAFAGCSSFASQSGNTNGDALVTAYGKYIACDKGAAEASFSDFFASAKEIEVQVALAVVAIEAESYLPVWSMLGDVKDYTRRNAISREIGNQCADHPNVVNFLQGAYYGLKNTEFGKWDEALITCESDDLAKFINTTASAPPTSTYDEKYNTMLKVLVTRSHEDALPVLRRAAVQAATAGGPFNAIIEKMSDAVQPSELGADITPENRKKLEEALVAIASSVAPEQAAMVADRLFNAGAHQAAASLLPSIYPDRVQSNGGLLYGVASIERCNNQVYLHYMAVTEPARRWSILADASGPARGVKKRLKCETEGDWIVIATPEPISSQSDLQPWIVGVYKQWESQGNQVKSRQEKPVALD